jgi:hypothetical protein
MGDMNRVNVLKWLPYWQMELAKRGPVWVKETLTKEGATKFLTRKDRMGLLKLLGLRGADDGLQNKD